MKRTLIVLVVAAISAGTFAIFRIQDRDDRPTFLTAVIERGNVTRTIKATGTVRAVVTVDVGSQLSGQVDELFVDFNDQVEKGQPIARIDQRSFHAKVRESEASLEAAKGNVLIQEANIKRAQSNLASAQAKIDVLRAQTARAKTALEAAERDLRRMRQLRQKGAAAERQLDEARTTRDVAAAQLEEAKAEETVHQQEIETAKADFQRAEAELKNARANLLQKDAILAQSRIELDRTVIRSPIKGMVIGRNIDKGQTVAASLEAPTLFKIAKDLSEMEVHARIDEADIGRIRRGQKAEFRVDAFPNHHFEGHVTQIRRAPEVVKNVVTYTVVITAPNPELLLLPGMTALVRIVVQESNGVLKLPNAALRFRPTREQSGGATGGEAIGGKGEGTTVEVWTLGANDELKSVRIQLGLSDATTTEIVGGPLREGEKIVVGSLPQDNDRRLFGLRFGF